MLLLQVPRSLGKEEGTHKPVKPLIKECLAGLRVTDVDTRGLRTNIGLVIANQCVNLLAYATCNALMAKL